ncbi:DUF6249 domain-containing protein [Salinispirillum marinum]|uniref:DUF6249 domain-containing protein n=2 Tax=Saccharospirillaceae TaxID=255527 RepID=A0ABV8BB80_9GAMM
MWSQHVSPPVRWFGARVRYGLTLLFAVVGLGLQSVPAVADQQGGISATDVYPTGQPVRIEPLIPNDGAAQSSQNTELSAPIREAIARSSNDVAFSMLIPLFGIIFLFGGPVLVVIVVAVLHYRSKARRTELRAQIILKALEAGRELPDALLPGDEVVAENNNLRRGVRNIGLGFAVLLPLGMLAGFDVGSLGFIPMSIGVAQVCLWRWVDRSTEQG